MNAIVQFKAVTELAEIYGLEADHFITTMKSVAMPNPHTDAELVSCLLVAREHGLNPLTKEIYFMRDKHGKIQAIVGVDGWIRKINEHPQFDGMTWADPVLDADGVATEMTCQMHRKDRKHPIEATEYMIECRQKRSKTGPWDTHPNRMLRNRTICQTARIAFGFAGVMERDEFDQWQETQEAPAVPLVASNLNTPRDGGPLILTGEAVKRPSANSFKQINGGERFNGVIEALAEVADLEDLQTGFDAHERNGMAWADFPAGWAKMIHDAYCHRLIELRALEGSEPLVPDAFDSPAEADAMKGICKHCNEPIKLRNPSGQCDHLKWPDNLTPEARISNGINDPEEDEELADQDGLMASLEESCAGANSLEILDEIIESNADLVARCNHINRLAAADLYLDTRERIKAEAAND